jgi:hypothetical protein
MAPSDVVAAIAPVVREFTRLGVVYHVGGSVASSAYGTPRSTLDVDLVADLMPQHVAPLVEALRPGYYIDAGMIHEAIAHSLCFNLIHLSTMFKVDVFVAKKRPYDRAVQQRAQERLVDEDDPASRFYLSSPEDVILSKLEWFRLGDETSQRQWLDVMGVLEVQRESLDRSYLSQWAAQLGVADLLQRAWNEVQA